jgi:Tol biopolymer transport system component
MNLKILLLTFAILGLSCQNEDILINTTSDYSKIFYGSGTHIHSISIVNMESKVIGGGKSLDFHPVVSPNNDKIAFYSLPGGKVPGIYLMDLNGENRIRLIDAAYENQTFFDDLIWSYDGQYLIYGSPKSGKLQIHTFNIRTLEEKQITTIGINRSPIISPDGQKIAYYSEERGDNKPSTTYIIDINGNNEHPLLPKGHTFNPNWSKDSKRILFGGNLNYTKLPNYENYKITDIYIANIDGTNLIRLTSDSSSGPRGWTPDESKILCVSSRDWDKQIFDVRDLYLINTNGSEIKRLTNLGYPYNADFSPDGKYISFVYFNKNNSKYRLYLISVDNYEQKLLVEENDDIIGITWAR